MYIHEYGKPDLPAIILLHPMEITGENLHDILIPFLHGQYHIIAPDQGGHGQSGPYSNCIAEAAELEKWLLEKNYTEIALLYGASMGVCVGYELLRGSKITCKRIWFDGGGLAPNAAFMSWIMKTMFIKKHRAKEDYCRKFPEIQVDCPKGVRPLRLYGFPYAGIRRGA